MALPSPDTCTARLVAAPGDRTPALVMVGPFSSVKEQTLPHYAERLAEHGYTVLTFDSRGFGASEPRRAAALALRPERDDTGLL